MDDVVERATGVVERFDYSSFVPEVREKVVDAYYRIRSCLRRTSEDVVTIGRLLLQVKDLIGDRLDGWAQVELGLSMSTVRRFMLAAKKAEIMPEIESLPPKVLYLLSEPSVPDAIVNQVIEKSKSGQKVTAKEVEAAVRQARAAEERARQLEADLDAALTEATDLRHRLAEAERELSGLEKRAREEAERADAAARQLARTAEELREVEKAYQDTLRELEEVRARPPRQAIEKSALEEKRRELERHILELQRKAEAEQARLEDLRRRAMQALSDQHLAAVAADQLKRLESDLVAIRAMVDAHAGIADTLAASPADLRAHAVTLAARVRQTAGAVERLAQILESIRS